MLPDKPTQRRVWQRVCSLPKPSRQPRQQLALCRRRAEENLRLYSGRTEDPIYGPAYGHLARLCREEMAMLERIR